MTHLPPRILILAGSRGGADPVAQMAGVERKAFAPVAGTPMLERVVETLRAALPEASLTIAMDPPDSPQSRMIVDRLSQGGNLTIMPPAESPARTVRAALPDDGGPILIATADHALLTPAMVRHFLATAPEDGNAAVAVATKATIAAAYPDTRRTYWRFADCQVSGCNLFLLSGEGAASVVEFWAALERDRKRPWAMIRRLGPLTLVRFALGLLRLDQALKRMGQRTGARLAAVDMPFAEAAMDVDRPSDLTLAERILAERILAERLSQERATC